MSTSLRLLASASLLVVLALAGCTGENESTSGGDNDDSPGDAGDPTQGPEQAGGTVNDTNSTNTTTNASG